MLPWIPAASYIIDYSPLTSFAHYEAKDFQSATSNTHAALPAALPFTYPDQVILSPKSITKFDHGPNVF